MILIIDHYDSFSHNLARYFRLAGHETRQVQCDDLSVDQAMALKPEAIIFSPGPCTPLEAGISVDLIRQAGDFIPMLGVCLGHQCIAQAYGGQIIRSAPVHGQASVIQHDGGDLFKNMPQDFEAGRYHSLSVNVPEGAPLEITAKTKDDIVMAIRHKTNPVYGVQFHPESILTPQGMQMIENFSKIARGWHTQRKNAA